MTIPYNSYNNNDDLFLFWYEIAVFPISVWSSGQKCYKMNFMEIEWFILHLYRVQRRFSWMFFSLENI